MYSLVLATERNLKVGEDRVVPLVPRHLGFSDTKIFTLSTMSGSQDSFHDTYITASNHQNRYDCRMRPATSEGTVIPASHLAVTKRGSLSLMLKYKQMVKPDHLRYIFHYYNKQGRVSGQPVHSCWSAPGARVRVTWEESPWPLGGSRASVIKNCSATADVRVYPAQFNRKGTDSMRGARPLHVLQRHNKRPVVPSPIAQKQ